MNDPKTILSATPEGHTESAEPAVEDSAFSAYSHGEDTLCECGHSAEYHSGGYGDCQSCDCRGFDEPGCKPSVAPKEGALDLTDDEAVVRAASVGVYGSYWSGNRFVVCNGIMPEGILGEADGEEEAWSVARQHPTVVAFEAQYRSTLPAEPAPKVEMNEAFGPPVTTSILLGTDVPAPQSEVEAQKLDRFDLVRRALARKMDDKWHDDAIEFLKGSVA